MLETRRIVEVRRDGEKRDRRYGGDIVDLLGGKLLSDSRRGWCVFVSNGGAVQ